MTKQILVVDDDPLMHRLLQHHFERAGYQMVSAKGGREAIDIATRQPPQLIVMDIMMPDMDGLEALRELKRTDATKAVPVLVITANGHYMARKESEGCGAAAFMTKPFSPMQLLTEVKRLIPPDE